MSGWFQKSGSSSDPSPESGKHDPAGKSAHQFGEGLGDHLKARAELLSIETREAGEVAARKGSLAIAAVVFLFFAYALVLATVVSLLGRWLESLSSQFSGLGWQLAALAAGFLHFLVALALFRKLKQKRELNLFEFTRAEFNKDREWLNQSKTSANENESSS
ncbi:MAG: hypothetical protein CMN05_03390 [Roseibacillus sp.]|jgi:uncharacterized membrane protein YqjE|nr:hypothetical protein [Roseibacillus sp.]MBP34834.1 hypothetical protein [Roseibacillus sp.]MBP34968.1 hypothetical protein [Roseibacillus sp.]MCP4730315.1 phage holin family protein [Roseibacillus sp.]MDP7105601.1 phage holin family protein [Roseibacillus sp.]|tara:strand:+ start:23164 stop:23649 length:486 start_codon:yes stop_codon:yes gene_type:complete